LNYRHKHVINGWCSRPLNRESGIAPISVQQNLSECGLHVASHAGGVSLLALGFHCMDHLGVDPKPSVEEKPPVKCGAVDSLGMHCAKTNGSHPFVAKALKHHAGCLNGIRRKTEGAGENIGATRRHGSNYRNVGGGAVSEHPIDDFVDGSVATKCDDNIHALFQSLSANFFGVASVVCLDHGDVVFGG
jgi:hypothetical protein